MNGYRQERANFIWSMADILRGDYKQSDYGKVILPMTVLRRLDCVLSDTKETVLQKVKELEEAKIENVDEIINDSTGLTFYNISKFDFQKLKADPDNIEENFKEYINGFSSNARELFEYYKFYDQIQKLEESDLLYLLISNFAEVNLHPNTIGNIEMGYIFEELIRKFSEQSNETAGEHFTPREVIHLMVNILFNEDTDILRKQGIIKSLYDPACGTGGMLSIAQEYLNELNPDARLEVFGQELNNESYAICNSDMLLKGQNPQNIKLGNSFSKDGFKGSEFDYMLSNPPYGVKWNKVQDFIHAEYESEGEEGRFGAGLPRIDDGSFLFVQHMVSKMKESGSKIGIVLNRSPFYAGKAESGESNIRKWLIENDLIEAIISLPTSLFYNTGIPTYIWILNNKKKNDRQEKIQLIDGSKYYEILRRGLGDKSRRITDTQISDLTRIYAEFEESNVCKIFKKEDFAFKEITIERPLKLTFHISLDRLKRLKRNKEFIKLSKTDRRLKDKKLQIKIGIETQEKLEKGFVSLNGYSTDSLKSFEIKLKEMMKENEIKIGKKLFNTIVEIFSERNEDAPIITDSTGNPKPDKNLKSTEKVPLTMDIDQYFENEVLNFIPDAWIDYSKTKVGYEIPFTKHFYDIEPINSLKGLEEELFNSIEFVKSFLEESK